MPTPVVYPSAKQFIGLAKETTQGTAVTPITATVPVMGFEPEDKPTWLEDRNLRGSMSTLGGMIQGVEIVDWSIPDSPAYLDTLPFFVNNILGDITDSGASAPFSHAISLLNSGVGQPGSLTLVDWQGPASATNFARVYPGSCVSELTIKGNAESSMILWSAKGQSWPSSVAAAPPTAAPSADTPFAAWRSLIGLAGPASGGTQVKTIREWEVTIKRKLKPEYTTQGVQTPFIIFRGDLDVTGKLSFSVPADESSSMTYLLGNTQPQLQILMNNGLSTTAARVLQIDCQVAAYDMAKINRSQEAVGYDTTFKAVINSTNAGTSGGLSPIKVTFQNNTAAATY